MAKKNNKQIRANLLLLGRSGTGKSEFINYILGNHIAKTGCGEPITQSFLKYEHILTGGLPITIYDSKGLEVDQLETISKKIYSFIEKKMCCTFVSDWIHAIFFFVNVKRARIENSEINLIREIHKITKQPIYIVMTHCNFICTSKEKEMMDEIKKIPGTSTIYRINSVDFINRKQEKIPAFGKIEIENDLPNIIWENTARKVSNQIASYLCDELKRCCLEHKATTIKQNSSLTRSQLKSISDKEYLSQLCAKEVDSILLDVSTKEHPLMDLLLSDFKALNASVCSIFHSLSSDNMINILFFIDLPWPDLADQIKESVNSSLNEAIESRNLFENIKDQLSQIFASYEFYYKKRQSLTELFYKELAQKIRRPHLISKHFYNLLKSIEP